jgi:hypothetical protein
MELIRENSYVKSEYDAERQIIYTKYFGTVNTEKSIEVLEAMLDFSQKNKIRAMLVDISELKGTFTMLNKWFEKNFFPPMIKQGMKCNAVIVSQDVFSQFAVNDLQKRIDTFEMQTFDDYKSGEDWLIEKLK